MPNKRKVVKEYRYEKTYGLPSAWPELESLTSEEDETLTDNACNELIEINIPWPVMLDTLGTYMPMLGCILALYRRRTL